MKKRKNKHVFLSVFSFFATLIFLVELAEVIWGVDQNNTLMAPNWFSPFLAVATLSSPYFVPLLWDLIKDKLSQRKAEKTNEHFPDNSVTESEILASIDLAKANGYASVALIQRNFRFPFSKAMDILDELETRGIIGPYEGNLERKVLTQNPWTDDLAAVDSMEGHAFEHWCADLLKKNNFTDVEVTQGSGDQGVDVLAKKDGIKYAIQCKCYSKDLGNTPVQEVNTGKTIYHCQIGVVMTNRFFTKGAKDAAEATGVLLWDRDKLTEMLNI